MGTRPPEGHAARAWLYAALVVVLGAQCFLGVSGVADQWTRGHNGWNGAAYHNAARNTLRWNVVFPLQYETGNAGPRPDQLYTHAPLGMHLGNVISVAVFGDHEASIRGAAAAWSLAVVCMLFMVVQRLWGDWPGLVAAAIYVALPINAIYANMPSHSSGFIFWSLLALLLYVRHDGFSPWRWASYVFFLGAFSLAALWDWPAYYVGFSIALHWGWRLLRSRAAGRDILQLAAFCVWVLTLFAGHFALVYWLTGTTDDLIATFGARRHLSWSYFRAHLAVVPELMFTWPVLALGGAWTGAWCGRLLQGKARRRDLVPLSFLFSGCLHYWLFRQSAVVHSYWAWPLLPFFAVAVSSTLFTMGGWIRKSLEAALGNGTTSEPAKLTSRAAGLSVSLLLIPLLIRDFPMVAEARRVGGSMWFVAPVRGAIETYDSGRAELRFAEQVKSWTDRETGVLLHHALRPLRLEPRFDITLDRHTFRWATGIEHAPPETAGIRGWVFVAPVAAFSGDARARFAATHPYREFGPYFMVDLRREGTDIEVWTLGTESSSAPWWLFHSAFEPPIVATRSQNDEEALRRAARIQFQDVDRDPRPLEP